MGLAEILRKNSVILNNTTTNINDVLAHLFQRNIISPEDKEEIKNSCTNPTDSAKSDKIYEILRRKELLLSEEILKEIFLETSNQHLVQLLWNSDIKYGKSSEQKYFYEVPPPNSKFSGRISLLKDIDDSFKNEKNSPRLVTVCKGLGGMGKTTAAIQYAYNVIGKLSVFWFSAESSDILEKCYLKLAKDLGIEDNVPSVKNWFENSCKNWLLIFDNAENNLICEQFFPRFGGLILITSRNSRWPDFYLLDVDIFDPDETFEFSEKVLQVVKPREEISELGNELGNLPLALTHALYLIHYDSLAVSEYVRRFRLKKRKYLHLVGHENLPTIAATWDITFKKIVKENPLASEFFNMNAYEPEVDRINLSKLTHFCFEKENNLESYFGIKDILAKYSMIKIDQNNYKIHRLVQEVLQMENLGKFEPIFNFCSVIERVEQRAKLNVDEMLKEVEEHVPFEDQNIILQIYFLLIKLAFNEGKHEKIQILVEKNRKNVKESFGKNSINYSAAIMMKSFTFFHQYDQHLDEDKFFEGFSKFRKGFKILARNSTHEKFIEYLKCSRGFFLIPFKFDKTAIYANYLENMYRFVQLFKDKTNEFFNYQLIFRLGGEFNSISSLKSVYYYNEEMKSEEVLYGEAKKQIKLFQLGKYYELMELPEKALGIYKEFLQYENLSDNRRDLNKTIEKLENIVKISTSVDSDMTGSFTRKSSNWSKIKKNEGKLKLYTDLATFYDESGHNSKAIEYWIKALDILKKGKPLESQIIHILHEIILLCYNSYDIKTALEFCTQAYELNPKSLNTIQILGLLQCENGDWAKVIENFGIVEKILKNEEKPDLSVIEKTIKIQAWAWYELDDMEKTLETLEKLHNWETLENSEENYVFNLHKEKDVIIFLHKPIFENNYSKAETQSSTITEASVFKWIDFGYKFDIHDYKGNLNSRKIIWEKILNFVLSNDSQNSERRKFVLLRYLGVAFYSPVENDMIELLIEYLGKLWEIQKSDTLSHQFSYKSFIVLTTIGYIIAKNPDSEKAIGFSIKVNDCLGSISMWCHFRFTLLFQIAIIYFSLDNFPECLAICKKLLPQIVTEMDEEELTKDASQLSMEIDEFEQNDSNYLVKNFPKFLENFSEKCVQPYFLAPTFHDDEMLALSFTSAFRLDTDDSRPCHANL